MLLKNYKYTGDEIKLLLKSMIILVDTREQKNQHITSQLKEKNINFKSYKLDFGDYSFMIPANNSLGIARDIYFNKEIVIERKNSLEELSGNLSRDRNRFENELLRKQGNFILLIENGSFDDIITGKYNTQMNGNAFLASLLTYQYRYNISIAYINKVNTCLYIYNTFAYYLKEWIK